MATLEVKCVLRYDHESGIVSCETKNWARIFTIKLQSPEKETMLRAIKATLTVEGADCDNAWIGVKPSDNDIASGLFGKKQLVVRSVDWEIV